MATILIIDDERSLLELLEIVLTRSGYDVVVAETEDAGMASFDKKRPDLVLLDLKIGGIGGLEVLKVFKERDPFVPVIVMTAYSTWDNALEAMRLGAYDFIKKPFEDNDLVREVIARALAQRAMLSNSERKDAASEILGNSPAIRNVLDVVTRVAPTDSTVLVSGESGTGKELLSRALHYCSLRAGGPFLSVNCAAFPEALLESELFGYAKGAFTGAHQSKLGLIEVCNRGTFFLDEIGEISPEMQVKLLRVLEDGKVLPVGATEPKKVDVRFICATNKDLEEEVAAGRFRADLYYRINVLPITLPPLRERRKDIPLLAAHFLVKYSKKIGRPIRSISESVQERLVSHHWPGNVRELENTIQRAVTLARGDTLEDMSLIPKGVARAAGNEPVLPAEGIDLESVLADLERSYLHAALERCNGHLTNAAKLLGISFRAIRYKTKKYGMGRSEQ